jgi:hypothetical protein
MPAMHSFIPLRSGHCRVPRMILFFIDVGSAYRIKPFFKENRFQLIG